MHSIMADLTYRSVIVHNKGMLTLYVHDHIFSIHIALIWVFRNNDSHRPDAASGLHTFLSLSLVFRSQSVRQT